MGRQSMSVGAYERQVYGQNGTHSRETVFRAAALMAALNIGPRHLLTAREKMRLVAT